MGKPSGSSVFYWVVRGSNTENLRLIRHHKFSGHAFSRCHFLIRLRHVLPFFRPKDGIIGAHNTKPILDQDNQPTFYKLTRYVFVAPRPLLLYNSGFAALYQKKPTRVWKVLEFCFSRETWDRRFIVSRSSSSFWVR